MDPKLRLIEVQARLRNKVGTSDIDDMLLLLRVRLELVKSLLVSSSLEEVPKHQGSAKMLETLISDLVRPKKE